MADQAMAPMSSCSCNITISARTILGIQDAALRRALAPAPAERAAWRLSKV